MLKENHITVQKTARYYTLGEMNQHTEKVCFVLHGFRQNGKSFIREFLPLMNEKNFIIAPEGLNRFYVDANAAKVGVTWMTKEDRLNEIKDYVNYLDMLYQTLNLPGFSGQITALGYSQGASTVTRWVNASANRFDQCIVFAGEVAPELLPLPPNSGLRRTKNYFMCGTKDEFFSPEALSKVKPAYHELHFTEIEFDGGHELRLETLKNLF